MGVVLSLLNAFLAKAGDGGLPLPPLRSAGFPPTPSDTCRTGVLQQESSFWLFVLIPFGPLCYFWQTESSCILQYVFVTFVWCGSCCHCSSCYHVFADVLVIVIVLGMVVVAAAAAVVLLLIFLFAAVILVVVVDMS